MGLKAKDKSQAKRLTVQLPPGSDEALDKGCQCPVLDNGHGRGIIIDGRTEYWINGDCPIHGLNKGQNKED